MELNYIEPPSIGEILREEFMEPMELSAYGIAQAIHVPVSRIQDILHNRRKITIDTSLRLAKLFGVSDEYFINMQNDIDIRMQKRKLDLELQQIKTYNIVFIFTVSFVRREYRKSAVLPCSFHPLPL